MLWLKTICYRYIPLNIKHCGMKDEAYRSFFSQFRISAATPSTQLSPGQFIFDLTLGKCLQVIFTLSFLSGSPLPFFGDTGLIRIDICDIRFLQLFFSGIHDRDLGRSGCDIYEDEGRCYAERAVETDL